MEKTVMENTVMEKIAGPGMAGQKKLLVGLLLLALAACQNAKPVAVAPQPEPLPVVAPQPVEQAPEYVAAPGLTPQQRIEVAIKHLERGEAGQAKAELETYLAAVPASKTAQDLIRQINAPAQEYYPAEARELTLNAGESLSVIAQKYLGSYYQFYALAKYNNIAAPRNISAGQKIRIPLTAYARKVFEAPVLASDPGGTAPTAAPADGGPAANPSGWSLVSGLVAEGKYEDAAQEVERQGRPDSLDKEQRRLGVAAYRNSAAALTQSSPTRAAARLLQVGRWLAVDNDNAGALDAMQQSTALDPGNAAATKAHADLKAKIADMYHKDASIAFRQQELDRAITLWEKTLAIAPDHKYARASLNQALELKAKLEALQ